MNGAAMIAIGFPLVWGVAHATRWQEMWLHAVLGLGAGVMSAFGATIHPGFYHVTLLLLVPETLFWLVAGFWVTWQRGWIRDIVLATTIASAALLPPLLSTIYLLGTPA